MTGSAELEQYIGNSRERLRRSFLSKLEGIEYGYTISNFMHITSVIARGSDEVLRLAMAEYRAHQDFQEALQTLRTAIALLDELENAFVKLGNLEERIPSEKSKLNLASFDYPLFCSVLMGDWPRCKRLALMGRQPLLVANSERVHDGYLTEKYLALVLDDTAWFDSIPLVEKKLAKTLFPPYIVFANAIRHRDQHVLDALLPELVETYRKRGTSRKDVALGFGFGRIDNQVSFDFFATGLCKIAMRKGIQVRINSEFIPKAFLEYWEN